MKTIKQVITALAGVIALFFWLSLFIFPVNSLNIPVLLIYLIVSNAIFLFLIRKKIFNGINTIKQINKEASDEAIESVTAEVNQELKQLQTILESYKSPLGKKRSELIINDDYGDPDYSKWIEEIKFFYRSKIIDKHNASLTLVEENEIFHHIEDTAFKNEQNPNKHPVYDFRFYSN